MAKKRICKICGKEYEYCGHCPSKNVIEPWRNLYCSENCRKVFAIFDKYVSKKMDAVEARAELEKMGFEPSKVREVHKPVISEIFKKGAKVIVEDSPKSEVEFITSVSEVKIGDPVIPEVPKIVEEKKVQKTFKPRPKFVNEKKD